MIKYDDFADRYHLVEYLVEAAAKLQERNKKCLEADFPEKNAMLFLERAVKKYLEKVN